MTLEDLLDYDADQWDRLTDEQKKQFCEPFLKVTRPELIERKPEVKSTARSMSRQDSPEDAERRRRVQRGRDIAKQFGLELE